MLAILSVLWSLVRCRLRSRAALELENLALRHQLLVLQRQRRGRPRLFSIDRLLWIGLYRLWPSRSRRPGRPRVDRAVRDLIRQISRANPLWGAPRIYGEVGKLGITVSQATVARCMPRRPKAPSPSWRSFLRNHVHGIAAADMFVVATAMFQLLYVLVVL